MSEGNDTRDQSYEDLLNGGTLGDKQLQVFKAICGRTGSNRQVSLLLGWPINRVTGRMKELRGMGLVEDAGHTYDIQTNRMVHVWRVKGK
jgi:hypothetical protein